MLLSSPRTLQRFTLKPIYKHVEGKESRTGLAKYHQDIPMQSLRPFRIDNHEQPAMFLQTHLPGHRIPTKRPPAPHVLWPYLLVGPLSHSVHLFCCWRQSTKSMACAIKHTAIPTQFSPRHYQHVLCVRRRRTFPNTTLSCVSSSFRET